MASADGARKDGTNLTRVAVVGSGAAGLSAAYLLQKDGKGTFEVTLFEKEPRAGGHAFTDAEHGPFSVDLGFQVFNLTTYPHLVEMFEELRVDSEPSCMSFSVSRRSGCGTEDGIDGRAGDGQSTDGAHCFEWGSLGLKGLFADWKNIFRPSFYRMILDALRFQSDAEEVLGAEYSNSPHAKETLGEFLERKGYGKLFIDAYVAPMCAAVWSVPASQALAMPAEHLIRFWKNHHLLDVIGQRPVWRVVKGRSVEYVNAILRQLKDVRMGTEVVRVKKSSNKSMGGVCLLTADGKEHHFQHVILATHTDTSLAMLDKECLKSSDTENNDADSYAAAALRILQCITYQENKMFLHGDKSLMPGLRNAWASWNCLSEEKPAMEDAKEVCVTYWLNHLQLLPESSPDLFCTLNPVHKPDDSETYWELSLSHPVFGDEGWRLQRQFDRIQRAAIARAIAQMRYTDGKAADSQEKRTISSSDPGKIGEDGFNVWFCGAWCGYGFHEDAVRSAVSVVHAMGAHIPWLHRLRERRLRALYPTDEVSEIIRRQQVKLEEKRGPGKTTATNGTHASNADGFGHLNIYRVDENDIDCAVGCTLGKTWTQSWYHSLFQAFGRRAVQWGGMRFILPTGEEMVFGSNLVPGTSSGCPRQHASSFGKQCRIRVLKWEFFKRIVQSADIGLGEAYMMEDFVVDDLVHFLSTMVVNAESATKSMNRLGILSWIGQKLHFAEHRANANTIEGSQANISAHYDLGNSMYMKFLDETMMYSSGIHFRRKGVSGKDAEGETTQQSAAVSLNNEICWHVPPRCLGDAQLQKLDAIIERLHLKMTDVVLEVGCGWGGFAIRASSMTGCKVVGITLSTEQLEEAEARASEAGVSERVLFRICDYRHLENLLKDDSLFASGGLGNCHPTGEPNKADNQYQIGHSSSSYRQEGIRLLTGTGARLPPSGDGVFFESNDRRFDKIVSIEMIEAVGHENLSVYFSSLSSVLKPGGLAVIQAITIPDERYDGYCKSSDFIKKYIFPGGHLPSMGAMLHAAYKTKSVQPTAKRGAEAVWCGNQETPAETLEAVKKASPSNLHLFEAPLHSVPHFTLLSVEDIGPDYAETLRCWRASWTEKKEEIIARLGYSAGFHRLFEFYFAYCEAAFRLEHLHDYILVWKKPEEGMHVISPFPSSESDWRHSSWGSFALGGSALIAAAAFSAAWISKTSKHPS